MQTQNLYKPFEVEFFRVDECPIKKHKHTFFELAFILEGTGISHVNSNEFEYKTDDLFLILPSHSHYTTVKTTTSFLFIRFNDVYFSPHQYDLKLFPDSNAWLQKLEYILHNFGQLEGPAPIRNTNDRVLIRAIGEALMNESIQPDAFNTELLQQLINTLLTVLARNTSVATASKLAQNGNIVLDIIHYIHQNICYPDKLRAEQIATHFNLSVNYISEYFKKHSNQNLQQYILSYKMSMIELRLKHSNMRLNEIASDFGFSDESHLTKTFKKNRGLTPSQFRKTISEQLSEAI
jgi:AraC-like DNA-binding protein